MSKLKIIDKKSIKSIKYERSLLSHLNNPFIVNMYYAFQDYDHLYLVMDLLTGGDLRYHICRQRKFTEEQTKFFICNIILGLEYIHNKRIIHRDIKPENLVMDNKGYIRITDFGISKIFSSKNYKETSGTPGYMSPEVMQGQNHNKAVDYFALGVICFECMMGKRPYIGKSRKEIKEQIMMKQIIIKDEDVPQGWNLSVKNFINKLLVRKPEMRLGYGNIKEVFEEEWIKDFPWDQLRNKNALAPFIPENKDNFDKRYCNRIENIGMETKQRYEDYLKGLGYQNYFVNYTYYPMLDNSDENNQSIINNNYNNNNNRTFYNKYNYKINITNNTNNENGNYESCNITLKKRCQSASIGETKVKNNLKNNNINNKIIKLQLDNLENYQNSNNKESEILKKKNKLFKTKSYSKTNNHINNNNNNGIKSITSMKKHLSFNQKKPKNNSSSKGKLNKNNNTNIIIHNKQNSISNPFLNYQNLKKTNMLINNTTLTTLNIFSQTLKHKRNNSSQNEKNKSINQRNNSNFSIKKISVNTYHSQGKNIKSPRDNLKQNSNRKNGIIGLEIRRIRKNSSKHKKSNSSSKKSLTNSSSVIMLKNYKVSNNSHTSTGSNSSITNNHNLKNKTINH